MSDDEETLDASQQLCGRTSASADTYEPGSTIKPFTVAAALETGRPDQVTRPSTAAALLRIVGHHDIHCINRDGHGTLTVKGADAELLQRGI